MHDNDNCLVQFNCPVEFNRETCKNPPNMTLKSSSKKWTREPHWEGGFIRARIRKLQRFSREDNDKCVVRRIGFPLKKAWAQANLFKLHVWHKGLLSHHSLCFDEVGGPLVSRHKEFFRIAGLYYIEYTSIKYAMSTLLRCVLISIIHITTLTCTRITVSMICDVLFFSGGCGGNQVYIIGGSNVENHVQLNLLLSWVCEY